MHTGVNLNEYQAQRFHIVNRMDDWQTRLASFIAISEEMHIDLRETRIERSNAYHERNMLLGMVAKMGRQLGWEVGIREQPKHEEGYDPDYKYIVFIEIPDCGQCSWHIGNHERVWFRKLPSYLKEWDGHTNEEKYEERIKPFLAEE